jgi:hypothetical protein
MCHIGRICPEFFYPLERSLIPPWIPLILFILSSTVQYYYPLSFLPQVYRVVVRHNVLYIACLRTVVRSEKIYGVNFSS